jgi:hypothetical protein
MGLRGLLAAAGLDPERDDIRIGPVPGATGTTVNFGLTAAEALEKRAIDGFWANGMATELAVTTGTGTIVLDVRRGDGPPGCFDYTMPVLATTDRLIEASPGAAATLRARRDPKPRAGRCRARPEVGGKRLPREAGLTRQHRPGTALPFHDSRSARHRGGDQHAFAAGSGIAKTFDHCLPQASRRDKDSAISGAAVAQRQAAAEVRGASTR